MSDLSSTDIQTSLRHPPTIKVVILGDLGVGKTCLRSQFIHHVFSSAYKATIGGDFLTTTLEVPKEESDETTKVNLQIWDTAGQERFNLISRAFYRGADLAILVYDITNYESLVSLKEWWSQFFEHCHVEAPGLVIVGNKMDKDAERCIDLEEVRPILCRNSGEQFKHYVVDWNKDVMETSCKHLLTVESVFQRVAVLGLAKSLKNEASRSNMRAVDFSVKTAMNSASSKCAC